MISKRLFWIVCSLLLLYRFLHFGETLDSPHTWRQSDTANYIYDFYINGIDLLHPSVCWMGGHKTLLLEFPLPEAIVSLLYHLFGASHIVARGFFFFSFLICVLFFYRIVKLLYGAQVSRLASLIYISVPLSLFFSRAVHIDFFTLALAHACMYYMLLGIRSSNKKHILIASIIALIGFPVKAPYFIPIAFPIVAYAIQQKKLYYLLRYAVFFVPSIIVFYLWQKHAYDVNNSAPDWYFLQGYRKFTDNLHWYFGPIEQRYVPELWTQLAERFQNEILGVSGLILFFLSGFVLAIKKLGKHAVWWFIGCIVYLLIFFNLNLVHNYYQVPFIAPLSIIIALGLNHITRIRIWLIYPVYGLIVLFAVESINFAENKYYVVQTLHMEIGEITRHNSNPDDLCIVSFHEMDSKCPNFLYAARRNGWTLPWTGGSKEVIFNLMDAGANKLIIARDIPLDGDIHGIVQSFPTDTFRISNGYQVYVVDLQKEL